MTPRRSTTTEQPTPLEETEPTQPGPELPVEDPPAEPESEPGTDAVPERPALSNPFNLIAQRLSPAYTLGRAEAVAEFEGAQREDYPLTVGEAIAEVIRRVGAIAKEHRAESGERYTYRGIDDVLLALHPILGDVGLVIMPGVMVEHRRETRATSKGGTLNVALVRVRYRLIGPDGSTTTGEAWGEAHDSGDKATQKALSQAYKSFTLQLFSIPTQGSADDEPDRLNEPGRAITAEEQQRAGNAYEAALNARTLEELVGVRRRAEHLLDVPVRMTDESLHPLRLLFESRRLALESATGGAS